MNNFSTSKKSKLDTGKMNIMHMVVWMNTAGATGKVIKAQVTRKGPEKKAQQAEVSGSTERCPEEGAHRHQGQGIGNCRCNLRNRRHAGGGREASQPLIGTKTVELGFHNSVDDYFRGTGL